MILSSIVVLALIIAQSVLIIIYNGVVDSLTEMSNDIIRYHDRILDQAELCRKLLRWITFLAFMAFVFGWVFVLQVTWVH